MCGRRSKKLGRMAKSGAIIVADERITPKGTIYHPRGTERQVYKALKKAHTRHLQGQAIKL